MIDSEDIDWRWIEENAESDPDRLRLSAYGDPKRLFEITQTDCRRRCRKKLSDTLKRYPGFLFPSTLSAQQSTSDIFADFHASLIEDGIKVLDMTGGLGIDGLHLSRKASDVTICELNPETAECAERNFRYIGANNVSVLNCDSVDFIRKQADSAYDCIFIDPARRGDHGKRLFALGQCQPDVTSIIDEMLRVAPRIIIKASPMLDIKHTISELHNVERIIVLGNRTECKELIIECRRIASYAPMLESVTIDKGNIWKIPVVCDSADYSGKPAVKPCHYIYDPFPSYAKICSISGSEVLHGVYKIAPSTNLYISRDIKAEFPGTPHEILTVDEMNKRSLKEIAISYPKIDVTAKNFPMTSAELVKKLKTGSSSVFRLFAFNDEYGKKLLAVCRRVE